jgi:hypothetical protein
MATKREVNHDDSTAKCTRCGLWKDVKSGFYANSSIWGFMPHCKACHKKYQKDWYQDRLRKIAADSVGPTPYDELLDLDALTDPNS